MEVHQPLPTQYLQNPYIMKLEKPSSAPSTPHNKDLNHIITQRRSAMNFGSGDSLLCSTDHSLYDHGSTRSMHSRSASTVVHNGRALTADRKRPYKCDMCSSKFGSKMELEEHQNSHTGLKPFECTLCKARFNRRSTLWNHKRIHSDDKPFECSVCRMTFKWKNSLKCHKEMHQRKNEITGLENDQDEKTLTYATAAKRRLMEGGDIIRTASCSSDSVHNNYALGSTPRKRGTKSLNQRVISSAPATNGNANSRILDASESFIHAPLQADGFFSNQKALSISDHKELDSLLSGTTRLSTMLKDEGLFKTNLCDDLNSIGGHSCVFDAKQEMNLFHANSFMVFGAHQLPSSVQGFTPANISLQNTNGSCGEYFQLQLNQGDQMQLSQNQSTIPIHTQQQYSENSSQADMLMNHNVITYQPQGDTQNLLAPQVDYTLVPTSIDYMLSSYQPSVLQSNAADSSRATQDHLHYSQAQVDGISADRASDGKELPQVSW